MKSCIVSQWGTLRQDFPLLPQEVLVQLEARDGHCPGTVPDLETEIRPLQYPSPFTSVLNGMKCGGPRMRPPLIIIPKEIQLFK